LADFFGAPNDGVGGRDQKKSHKNELQLGIFVFVYTNFVEIID
jgi:hypothetical protein